MGNLADHAWVFFKANMVYCVSKSRCTLIKRFQVFTDYVTDGLVVTTFAPGIVLGTAVNETLRLYDVLLCSFRCSWMI